MKQIEINKYAYQSLDEGDIVYMYFGEIGSGNIEGSEQAGRRPVILLEKLRVDSKEEMLLIAKCSRKDKIQWDHIRFIADGLDTTTIMCEHIGSYSKNRICSKKIATVDKSVLEEIRRILAQKVGITKTEVHKRKR